MSRVGYTLIITISSIGGVSIGFPSHIVKDAQSSILSFYRKRFSNVKERKLPKNDLKR